MHYPIPYGLKVSVTFRREEEVTFVDVHAPLYLRKEWTLPFSYSPSFTNDQILHDHDFTTTLFNHYER